MTRSAVRPAKSEAAHFEDAVAAVRRAMEAQVDSGYVPGLVWGLDWHGRSHVEWTGRQAFGGSAMRRGSIFRIASIGKLMTAAAAMVLVEEGRTALDDPVDPVLPELADRQVLLRIDAPLDKTVPARRPITLRDLLTMCCGFGAIMVSPPRYPIQLAMEEHGIAPSAEPFSGTSREFMRRLGELPLAAQPGEAFLYHSGIDVAGVLIERVSDQSLGAFMQDRIFGPLGMTNTGFVVPPEAIDRLVTAYLRDPASGQLAVFDEAAGGRFAGQPSFEAGGGGQVSTVDDYLRFCRMLLGLGAVDGVRILQPTSVAEMTRDQLTAEQKRGDHAKPFFDDGAGWGLGMQVSATGRYGWTGGYGTTAFCDPQNQLIGVLMTQRVMDSPSPPPTMTAFWESVDSLVG